MKRFKHHSPAAAGKHRGLPALISVCLFALVVFLLFWGMDFLSKKTLQEQKVSLENALSRSVVECYAAEGAYPKSLSYLKDYYGLNYDENKFFVDYQPIGENILPEFTVILRSS